MGHRIYLRYRSGLPRIGKKPFPSSRIISDEQEIFDDQSVEAVGLFALANSRKEQIEKAVRSNKHILTEKPIADTIDKEWENVDLIEKYDRIAAVNLYLRNSWYHQAMKQFIDEGEIGELAILRICHMTPGLAPGEDTISRVPPTTTAACTT